MLKSFLHFNWKLQREVSIITVEWVHLASSIISVNVWCEKWAPFMTKTKTERPCRWLPKCRWQFWSVWCPWDIETWSDCLHRYSHHFVFNDSMSTTFWNVLLIFSFFLLHPNGQHHTKYSILPQSKSTETAYV